MKFSRQWLTKLFDSQKQTIEITAVGLSVPEGSFDWLALDGPLYLDEGLFFASLILQSKGEQYFISWLSKTRAKNAVALAGRYWCQSHFKRAELECAKLEAVLNSRYLRRGQWLAMKARAKAEISRWPHEIQASWLTEQQLKTMQTLNRIAAWNEQDLESHQQQFITAEKQRFNSLFSDIESNPLTEQQQEACIRDEVNNLVLAGAGTGKTSTMVGRAGYLLKSADIAPDEILLLAYGNKAAREMDERINHRLGIEEIKASTFHSLGLEIISRVEGAKPNLSPLAQDETVKLNWVQQQFNELLNQSDYRQLALTYFERYLFPEKSAFDFSSQGEHFNYLRANEVRSLKGDVVKSYGELLIANWLFKMGVDYQYQADYEVPIKSLDFRNYQADFYLSEFDIYIEHWDTDTAGNTAPFVDREAYYKGMQWKRETHSRNQTVLLETCYAEQQSGQLFRSLEKQLRSSGVVFNPIPDEEIFVRLREFGAVANFAGLLSQMLGLYKAACQGEKTLQNKFQQLDNAVQTDAAMTLFKPVFVRYQNELKLTNEIDFEDMISKALEYVQRGLFLSRWSHIMVDEFQDISESRARLIRALRDAVPGSSLFCVGDDWQAIYRFTGSDVSLTTGFEDYFGVTAVTKLAKTFRFNNSISDIATRFVTQNPAQLKKQLTTHLQVDKPAVSLLQSGEPNALDSIFQALSKRAKPDASVYLLARYHFLLPDPAQFKVLQDNHPGLQIDKLSFHASKGKEADYVVVLGLQSGKHGFPSEKMTNPLLEALLPTAEPFAHAEERRLFYVALTRAKHRVYLLCNMTTASAFVTELIDDHYPIERNEFDVNLSQRLFQKINCIHCKTGVLTPREGKFGRFFSCSNYPPCHHAEKGCAKCHSAMMREGRYKKCINPECNHKVPVCPKCGAEMVQREGPYGPFWGCKNFRGQENPSCDHKEKVEQA